MPEQQLSKREAISQVKALFKKINSDARLPNKLVWSLLKKHSIWLVKRDSEQLKLLKKHELFQSKKCVKVIAAPSVDPCCGLKVKGCIIYRTENRLPEMYEDLAGVIIKRVSPVDMDSAEEVTIYNLATYKRLKNHPFASKKEYKGFYNDGYLYFPEKHLRMIEVEAMFLDEIIPDEDCNVCAQCDAEPCKKYLDAKWIIPDYLQAQAIDYTLKDLANTFIKIPEPAHTINKNDNG